MPTTRICRISGKEFIISDEEMMLLDKISPLIGEERFPLPFPTLCPEERQRRRSVFKNYFSLHKRQSTLSGKPIISIYSPESPYNVYSQEEWWSDRWNPLDYGRGIDFSRPFFPQLSELHKSVPVPTLENAYKETINSEYINANGKCKDCYLTSLAANNESCLYAFSLFDSTNILNSNYVRFCENCSFSDHIWKCHNVHYAFDTSECRDSEYVFSCKGSHHLLGCVSVENSSYRVLNREVTSIQYQEIWEQIHSDPLFRKHFESQVLELIEQVGLSDYVLTGSENSTGDFCYDSKSCIDSYSCGNCENAFYLSDCYHVYDSLDIAAWGNNTTLSYDSAAVGDDISHVYWSYGTFSDCSYAFYDWHSLGSSYIFGTYGLKHQKYSILNTLYSKHEWESLFKKLVNHMRDTGEWGEFLDANYTPFGYNETHAYMLFPLEKEEAIGQGFSWGEKNSEIGDIPKIPAEKLPFDIRQVPDDILNWAIICENTGKLYKIQEKELAFLRKFRLPLPHLHPTERIKKFFEWDKRKFDFYF